MSLPDFQALITIYGHIAAQKYYYVACSVVLFWDIGITFGQEVEYIWKQRWSPFTFLWFLLRYIPPLMEIVVLESLFDSAYTPEMFVVCRVRLPFAGSVSVVCVTLVQCVFVLRMYALYGLKKPILIAFGLFLAGEIAFMAFLISRTVELPKLPGAKGCAGGIKSFGSRGAAAFCAPPFIFDVIVFGMTMYKSYIAVKDNRSSGVLSILLRDGSLYFVCVFCTSLANFVTLLRAPGDLTTINANMANTLPVVITSRLILNLKSIAYRQDATLTSRDNVPIEFNHHYTRSSGYTGSSWNLTGLVDVLGETGHPVAPPTSAPVEDHRRGIEAMVINSH